MVDRMKVNVDTTTMPSEKKAITWSQFHQHFTYEIFVQKSFWQLFSSYMCAEKAAKTMFVRKICTENVDEIDTWDQLKN